MICFPLRTFHFERSGRCDDERIFLKTIIPSRKATKAYQKEREDKNEIR